jgi:pimeloyl-ACP methyl ester carboxylesterase
MNTIVEMAAQPDHFLHGILDGSKVAVVGYSMGGYGALTTAGAGYNDNSMPMHFVPGGYMKTPGPKADERLKAIVAIAPWGEQPPYSTWDVKGLAGIKIPSLFIAGDHDDVADYTNGIKPAFDEAVHSERCMLVYENARHNTGGNPAPDVAMPFLKGDESKASYLHVQPEKSDDGKWQITRDQHDAGAYSTGKDAQGELFWKGFQRRQALGLEMTCKSAE